MRKEYQAFIEAIETATAGCLEYETTHDDAASAYIHCIPDDMTFNNAADRLAEFLAAHDLPAIDCDAFLEHAVSFDIFETVSGSMFGCPLAFYSANEYHASTPQRFVCASYSVDEVETQCDLKTLSESRHVVEFARLADKDNRVCIRYTAGSDNLLSYEATDCVWFFTVELENVRDWIAEQTPVPRGWGPTITS